MKIGHFLEIDNFLDFLTLHAFFLEGPIPERKFLITFDSDIFFHGVFIVCLKYETCWQNFVTNDDVIIIFASPQNRIPSTFGHFNILSSNFAWEVPSKKIKGHGVFLATCQDCVFYRPAWKWPFCQSIGSWKTLINRPKSVISIKKLQKEILLTRIRRFVRFPASV